MFLMDIIMEYFYLFLLHAIIIASIFAQLGYAGFTIYKTDEFERYILIISFSTAVLIFLGSRTLKISFADFMLIALTSDSLLRIISFGGVIPALTGICISHITIQAMKKGKTFVIRVMILVSVFTAIQLANTYLVVLSNKDISLDKALVPNTCYSVCMGLWLVFFYKNDSKE